LLIVSQGAALLEHVERDIHDHVFLTADHLAAA
jgi:hypothetical protein